jgi:hypothetical protein
LEELVSLPNFEPVSGPASPEKALHQFKIRLINEITYPNGNTIEDHTSSEVTSRLTSSMELYSNTYRQAQQYDLTQEWSRGPNDMIVALKASPAFYDRFFEESSKYLGAKHFPCFVAYFLQIPSAIIPESPLPALSHVLLLVLKIKLGLRKYLKPLKDQLLLRINSK